MRRFLGVFGGILSFLVGLVATAPAHAEGHWTPSRLLKAIETLEQVGIDRSAHDQLAPLLDARLQELSQIASETFQKETGIAVVDKPVAAGWNVREMNEWVRTLRGRKQEDRCDLIRLAYAVAISRLSVMKPSVSEAPSVPVSDSEKASPAFGQDVDRAIWEFRYFWVLQADAPWASRGCMDFTFPQFSIVHEAQARIKFLEFGVDDGENHFQRWPVGRAKKMCGRPFHTHYVDHLTFESTAREMDAEPLSLQSVKDAATFQKKLRELERKALRSL